MTTCPKGYTCRIVDGITIDPSDITECNSLKTAISETYGNVLDGIYCPGGNTVTDATLKNCPKGYYCPDPALDPIICPKGYFCPTKTSTFEDIACSGCKEGAEEFPILLGGFLAMLFCTIVLPILIYIGLGIKKRMAGPDDDGELQKKLKERQHADLQRAKPLLEMIDERLGNAYTTKHDTNGDLIDYDAEILFDAIDQDNNGVLSLKELSKAMNLFDDQLLVFIQMMNEASGFSTRETSSVEISREVFSSSFLETVKAVANFDPSQEDAEELFDAIVVDAGAMNGTIPLKSLRNSSVALFLNDKQILTLIRLFEGRLSAATPASKSDADATKNNVFQTICHFGPSAKKPDEEAPFEGSPSLQESSVTPKNEGIHQINRDTFVYLYPSLLSEVVNGVEEQLEPCDIHFQNLSLHVSVNNNELPVVNDVTGRVRSGTMTALMGGSGAGKTSLLNALCGRAYYGTVSGEIAINGKNAHIEDCTDVMGFVPQDDIVFAELTVKENLVFAGKFKLPRGTPLSYIERLADDVIADLGLSRVAHSIVGDVHRRGVSGGEKKRVNIGLELMAKPSILFLDEPTSGLDSSSAMVVMQSLKQLVWNQGMTICSVIHQPRKAIFELFDSLILLGYGGNLVYHGPTKSALEYFTKMHYALPQGESLADWLIDISSGELSSEKPVIYRQQSNLQQVSGLERVKQNREILYKAWKSHFDSLEPVDREIYNKPKVSDLPSKRERANFISQTWYQFSRCAILLQRNLPSKLQEAFLIVGGTVAVTLLDGTLTLSKDSDPDIPNEYTVLTLAMAGQGEMFEQVGLPSLFAHAARGLVGLLNYGIQASLAISVLSALASNKAITEKRVEFFREASSGYDINAYYMAVNAFDTLEVAVRMILAATFTYTLRNSITSVGGIVLQFVLFGWISASWGLLFPLFVPSKNVVLATGFFTIFTGLLLSGAPGTPITYDMIYDTPALNIISSFLAPPRFFVESLAVSEMRATAIQHGFTETFPGYGNGFTAAGLGEGDADVNNPSDDGWYWGVLPSIFVGLTIRCLGFIMLHSFNRPMRLKNNLFKDFKEDSSVQIGVVFFLLMFGSLVTVSIMFFRK